MKKFFIFLLVVIDIVLFFLIAISLLSGWRYGASAPQNTGFFVPSAIHQNSTDKPCSLMRNQELHWNFALENGNVPAQCDQKEVA